MKKEEMKLKGEDLLKKVKQLISEGNVRHITVLNKENKVIMEFPLTIGVVGAAMVPVLAAIGAVAALVTDCSIRVERDEDKSMNPLKKLKQ